MKYASRVTRIGAQSVNAWAVHQRATARQYRGDDIILLSIGDPDFDTPPAIVDATLASLHAGRTHYSSAAGERSLRAAIVAYHASQTGQTVASDQVVVLPGAQCGLYATAQCLLQDGDELICPEPRYVTYEATIAASGARLVEVPLRPERGFHLDPNEVAAAIGPRTRAILINSPHNPTGAVATREELNAIAELCIHHDLWLIADEVYNTLTFEHTHICPATLPGMAERTVLLASLSKVFAMSGWRLGWAITPPELAQHLSQLAACMLFGVATFIQDAARHALSHDIPETTAMREAYRRRRDLVCERLAGAPGITFHRPEGGMYFMLDIRPTGLSGEAFANGLLDHSGVAVLPGEGFGPSAAGHVRLSLSVADESLAEACKRIVSYVGGLSG